MENSASLWPDRKNNTMSKLKPARVLPKIAGCQVYGNDDLKPAAGNTVYKHAQKYHVFNGLKEVLVTADMTEALTAAAKAPTA